MKKPLAAGTSHYGSLAQRFDDDIRQRGAAADAGAVRDGGDGWRTASVNHRLVRARDGGGKLSQPGRPAAPQIVHLGVEPYPPLLGVPQRGLELQRQPAGAGLISSGRGETGALVGVVISWLLTHKGAAPLSLCARDGDLAAKTIEPVNEFLPYRVTLAQQVVDPGQLCEEEAIIGTRGRPCRTTPEATRSGRLGGAVDLFGRRRGLE